MRQSRSLRKSVHRWLEVLVTIGMAASTSAAMAHDGTDTSVLVPTDAGVLSGQREAGVAKFMGIPYAVPPVAGQRWKAPIPAPRWEGARDATLPGPICYQQKGPRAEAGVNEADMSEDCLYLNVWKPVGDGPSRPVMVWIHGGAFRGGAGSLELYDGAALAKQGVVVVTINYRLGAFGTLSLPQLRAEGGATGNFGLLDQALALKWVQDNIAAFGGDPKNVTLFGESAGGASVLYQMIRPEAQGLFHQAIVESGAIDLPEVSQPEADRIGLRMVGKASGLRASDVTGEQLRAMDAQKVLSMPDSSTDTMPFIDGTILKRPIVDAFQAGEAARIPLLIGRNDDEAAFFPEPFWSSVPQKMGAQWPAAESLVTSLRKASDPTGACYVAGLLFVGVNTRAVARAAADAGNTVNVFRFEQVPSSMRDSGNGAEHTGELPYVFGTLGNEADGQDQRISKEMIRLWTSFAKGESLRLTHGRTWPAFTRKSERVLCIGGGKVRTCDDPDQALLDYLDRDWAFQVN